MTSAFAYATVVSAILAVVLAVARDVPILHLLMPPDLDDAMLGVAVWFVPLLLLWIGCGVVDGIVGPKLLAATWAIGLAHFWWSVAWHLRERR
jgi:hypothetical protein